ncbi:hypothetical protein [Amnibacterium kyonggiense]|uniref:Uncharacterized protein n=1 Tax=Amnibacterium kyonggiense TaxID=595671 RepID=A0A4R7FJD1_9MICO|nr:hypothetical protein [Amnibacterium kyonggiense]TDS76184.1 hypothetical protein CLV52_3304 [Amnibacterium kyonggiense]
MNEDARLREAMIAFEQSVLVAPDQPAPALPAFVGLLRAVGGLTRFALDVALAADRSDPIDLEPRVLRTA